jgi:NDP-sugar pyrophosphorylase family protein
MILAAGLGTRLRPLTDLRPKPLVPVANEPVIRHTIAYLKNNGITRLVVNAHHHAEQVSGFFENPSSSDIPVEVRFEPRILGTGGGLMNVADFWGDDTLLVVNGDILTDIDLGLAIESHKDSGSLATLILHEYAPFNQVLINGAKYVTDISDKAMPGRLAFTGIHILEPGVREWLPDKGYADIITSYREMMSNKEPISAYVSENHYWRDIGTIESYMEANREFSNETVLIAPGCTCHASVVYNDWSIIGAGCVLEKGVEIERSILWEGVRVGEGVRVVDSIVTSGREVVNNLKESVS